MQEHKHERSKRDASFRDLISDEEARRWQEELDELEEECGGLMALAPEYRRPCECAPSNQQDVSEEETSEENNRADTKNRIE